MKEGFLKIFSLKGSKQKVALASNESSKSRTRGWTRGASSLLRDSSLWWRSGKQQWVSQRWSRAVRRCSHSRRQRRGPIAEEHVGLPPFLREQSHGWLHCYKDTGWRHKAQSVWTDWHLQGEAGYEKRCSKPYITVFHNKLLSLSTESNMSERITKGTNFTLTLISPGGGFS